MRKLGYDQLYDQDGFKIPPPYYNLGNGDLIPSVVPFYNVLKVMDELEKYYQRDVMNKEIVSKFPKGNTNLYVLLYGRSAPENTVEFYKNLEDLIVSKWLGRDENLVLIFSWKYINSTTHKQLLELIKNIAQSLGDRFFVLWFTDDDEIEEKGEDIKGYLEDKDLNIYFLIRQIPFRK